MDFTVPQVGGEIIFGGIGWTALSVLIISTFTQYVKPLTEKQIQLFKAFWMVGGYVLLTVVTNNPEYENTIIFVSSVLLAFFASTGIYEDTRRQIPSLSSNVDRGDKIDNLEGDRQYFDSPPST